MFCSRCGNELPAESPSCPHCDAVGPPQYPGAAAHPAYPPPAAAAAPVPYAYAPCQVIYPPQPVSGKAIASMVLGIASFVTTIILFIPVGPILALYFGLTARREIDAGGGVQAGRGYATAGIVLGIVGICIAILFWVLILFVVILGETTSSWPRGGLAPEWLFILTCC